MSSTSNIYFSECERLKTFLENGWPHSFLSPEAMAKCGFYYTGVNDDVKCPFCNVVLCDWISGDVPIREHIRASGRCQFVNGYDVGNIFIGDDPREIFDSTPGEDVCGLFTPKITASKQIDEQKKLSKNAKKKLRKKRKKSELKDNELLSLDDKLDDETNFDIEYIEDELPKDSLYYQFMEVFDKFKVVSAAEEPVTGENTDPAKTILKRKQPGELEFFEDNEQKISKRKSKLLKRMTVAELKLKVAHPELVEMVDITAKDPLLLLNLKSIRNSVPVPRHWCFKRKYLQGKRGFEKPSFVLPDFIKKTGIMEMRNALQEKEDAKSLKTRQKEKIRPKLGKIDIDYQKLHDAFFKWQSKPKMTIHGEIYYEGKENETRLKEKKPGDLSVELRVALGMPTGPNGHKCPPPWLIAMQRYGPPPSYPNLKIPGLNAKIPDGCSFGYHAGGWGKPPVDEFGRPLYGDVFGTNTTENDLNKEEKVEKKLWGEIQSEEEEEEEKEEEEEEEEEAENDKFTDIANDSGFFTASDELEAYSVDKGMETPAFIELRKKKIEDEMESNENASLFTIIPEKKTERNGKEIMLSNHIYDVTGFKRTRGVEVSLDPNDLEMPIEDLTAKYKKPFKQTVKEDLSDMVAEHVASQKRKKTQDTFKSNKKYKDFKF